MTSQRMYKIHKWLAVSVGAFFLTWMISGVVMILPRLSPESQALPIADVIDMKTVSVSAQEAVAKLTTNLGEVPQLRALSLKRIADTYVYEILTANHGSHLLDAQSGERFSITAPRAEAIVKRQMAPGASRLKVELLSRHELSYPWGPLPVYRVMVAEDPSTAYYVSSRDGTVSRSDRESRIRNAIASIHTLDPIKLVIQRDAVRKGLLLFLSVVGITAVGSGFYLALRP